MLLCKMQFELKIGISNVFSYFKSDPENNIIESGMVDRNESGAIIFQ